MMLTTSYAWYSFENASTAFEGMTTDDEILVSYGTSQYISTSTAIPISSADIDEYSEKNNFSITVRDSAVDNELVVSISLVEINIAGALQNANFKIELYYQGSKINTVAGNSVGTSGATTKSLGTVTLSNTTANNFEVRVYILDDGTNQSSLEGKTFSAKIQVNIVSRTPLNVILEGVSGNNSFTIKDGASYINVSDDVSAVPLSLVTEDAATMCISVNTSACTNYIAFSDTYTLDWSSESDGEKVVYVYYKDSADDIIAAMSESIILDRTAPSDNSVSIGGTDGISRTLTIASTGADYMCFSETSNSASDCTEWIDFASTYDYTFSEGTGTKTIYAFFRDEAGNTSGPATESTICTNNCTSTVEYEYWMDAYDQGLVYLVRSDGATAVTSVYDTSVAWFAVDSQEMNTCAIDSSAIMTSSSMAHNTLYAWCIGTDNNVYYKTLGADNWNMVAGSTYFDTASYSYSIYPYNSTNVAYVVRMDGKRTVVNTSSVLNSFTFGYDDGETLMSVCSGSGKTGVVACISVDGSYYYTRFGSTIAYTRGVTGLSTPAWIDIYVGSKSPKVALMELGSDTLYNSMFLWNDTFRVIYESSVPGGGVKNCAGTGSVPYNICLAEDNYLYYKVYSATEWTKSTLAVEE